LQDEVSELKQKLKVMNHQTEQLRENITTKEAQFMKEVDGNTRIITFTGKYSSSLNQSNIIST